MNSLSIIYLGNFLYIELKERIKGVMNLININKLNNKMSAYEMKSVRY